MKRMWTEREIRSLAVDSVEKKTDLKVFEHIVDKDGHKRFIEGAVNLIDPATGFTKSYGKWSLSGTHLQIVLACKIDAGTSFTAGTLAQVSNLPSWIVEKITPIVGQRVSVQNEKMYTEGLSGSDIQFILGKSSSAIYINLNSTLTSIVADNYFRVGFDILVDNE